MLVALSRVVEHHVDDHFDSGLVKGTNHLLEFLDLLAVFWLGRIGCVGREEGGRLIAPQVHQRLAGKRVHAVGIGFLELNDRKQFDRSHPQLLQIGELFHQPGKCPRIRYSGRRMLGEAAHMRLINDAVHQRDIERLIVSPIEGTLHQQTVTVGPRARFVFAPGAAIGERVRIGIEQHVRGMVTIHLRIGIGLHVEAVTVLAAGVQSFDEHVPHLAGSVGQRIERELNVRVGCSRLEEHQRARGGMLGKNRKVHTAAAHRGA